MAYLLGSGIRVLTLVSLACSSRLALTYGSAATIRFPQKLPDVDLTIYEKSAGVGGTWFNNRYPYVSSSASHNAE